MSLGRYALVVMAVVGGTIALAWPVLGTALGPGGRSAALVGGGLAAANTVLAYFLVLWSAPRSTNVFLRAVLWGTAGRMALMLLAVLAAVVGLGLPRVPLVVSLLGYFVLLLVFELTVLSRTTSAPREAR